MWHTLCGVPKDNSMEIKTNKGKQYLLFESSGVVCLWYNFGRRRQWWYMWIFWLRAGNVCVGRFKISAWNVGYIARAKWRKARTTNGAEIFHRHFKEDFAKAHPNIFSLFNPLLSLQEETYIRLQNLASTRYIPTNERNRLKFVHDDTFAEYENPMITRKVYVRQISYKFSPVL